jgi:hypothetical protein
LICHILIIRGDFIVIIPSCVHCTLNTFTPSTIFRPLTVFGGFHYGVFICTYAGASILLTPQYPFLSPPPSLTPPFSTVPIYIQVVRFVLCVR